MGNAGKFLIVGAITVDGERYFVDTERDITTSEGNLIQTLKEQGRVNTDGSPALNRNEVPAGVSAQSWKHLLDVFEARWRSLQARTVVNDAARFADREPRVTLAHPVALTPYGNSTHRLERDDGAYTDLDPQYAEAYARAYGVELKGVASLPYRYATSRACGEQEVWARRVIHMTDGKSGVARYDCNRPMRFGPGQIIGIARAFLQKYKAEIDAAVGILAKNHPKLHRENIALFFEHLILNEFMFFNDLDLGQDIAAGKYAEIPESQLDRIEENSPNTVYTIVPGLPGGSLAWRAYGWLRDAPPGIQGFGPLQIIPSVAESAGRNKPLLAAYSPIVSAADFRDEKAVIRAILDPKKMFAVKAMTWDLQLRELEKTNPGLVPSIRASPYIANKDTARELVLLVGATELVQFPENTAGIQEGMSATALEPVVPVLFMMGDVLRQPPILEGIRTVEVKASELCPALAFGAVKRPDGSQICVLSGSQ